MKCTLQVAIVPQRPLRLGQRTEKQLNEYCFTFTNKVSCKLYVHWDLQYLAFQIG